MNILGISAFYHDSAACLVCGGEIVAAAQDARGKVEAAMQSKMQEVTGGLPLPPGLKLW